MKGTNIGSIFLFTLFLSFFFLILPKMFFAWRDPSDQAPKYIVPPPLNTSGRWQVKSGSLDILFNFTNLGSRTMLENNVGVGSLFDVSIPRVALDVDGTVRANLFCFKDPTTHLQTNCLSVGLDGRRTFVGPKGPVGDSGPQGLASTVVGPRGFTGVGVSGSQGIQGPVGPRGPAGPNTSDITAYIQRINRGANIIFRDDSGSEVSYFGVGGANRGTIGRDFMANPCTGPGEYIKSIDPNGATTCVSTNPPGGGDGIERY